MQCYLQSIQMQTYKNNLNKMPVLILLQIECFDWDKDTEHDMIGGFETTLRELAPAKDREV